jgi:hypothetical protein
LLAEPDLVVHDAREGVESLSLEFFLFCLSRTITRIIIIIVHCKIIRCVRLLGCLKSSKIVEKSNFEKEGYLRKQKE